MAAWELWYPEVLVHVPGAPLPIVDIALRSSAREFFERTQAWLKWLEQVSTMPPTSINGGTPGPFEAAQAYEFVLPIQTEVVKIRRATIEGKDLPVHRYEWTQADPQYSPGTQGKALVSENWINFRVLNDVSAGKPVQVFASLRPSLNASGLPDHLASQFYMAIADGARRILMLTPGAFFNGDLAAVASRSFELAISSAHYRAYLGKTATMPRLIPSWC